MNSPGEVHGAPQETRFTGLEGEVEAAQLALDLRKDRRQRQEGTMHVRDLGGDPGDFPGRVAADPAEDDDERGKRGEDPTGNGQPHGSDTPRRAGENRRAGA